MILTRDDGIIARTLQDADQAQLAGCVQCATYHAPTKMYCTFWLSPEAQTHVTDAGGGYYTCPVCKQSHDLLHEMPWHGVAQEDLPPEQQDGFTAGGGTRIGLGMDVQGQIGEDLVEHLGEIPGYGPITWVHEGGAVIGSPLDMATADWGIEVKTLGYDAAHHRFIPGRPKEKQHKNDMAKAMNKKGILGVLVLLDYRRSMADIYVREFPIEDGIKAFRTGDRNAQHLVKSIPFRNPLMDPHDPSPKAEGFGGDSSGMPF